MGLIGIWKGFQDLQELAWIEEALSKMVAVQPEGCTPIVDACASQPDFAVSVDQVETVIQGMLIAAPFANRRMLETFDESGGFGMTNSNSTASHIVRMIARLDGQLLSLGGAAVVAA